jgi:homogentisate 1,2-dioxygenase
MFESRFVCRPTKFAMDTAARQHEYYTCWQTLKKNFKPTPTIRKIESSF